MIKKIRDNGWLLLSAAVVFVLVYLFFAVAHPVVPYDNDDWNYLGLFRRALPVGSEWNPSRVFQEVITPLAGYFSAFIVYPLTHDYVGSFAVTIALICAVGMTVLYYVLYRLFLAFCNNRVISSFSGLTIICLFFAFFKTQTDSAYMLFAYNLNTILAYSIPNLLNSILVCILVLYSVNNRDITLRTLGIQKLSLFIIAAYCSVFSMLFSNIIVAVYCFYTLLFCVIKKEKITGKIALIAILLGFLYYCYLEFFGTRANSELGGSSNASLFSAEFLFQLQQSYWNFTGMLKQIHKPILCVSLFVIFFAMVLCILDRKLGKENPYTRTGLICLFSCISLAFGLVLICGKAGPSYSSLIQCMYGIFFYFFLLTGIALTYIISRFKKALVIMPLALLMLFNETTNSTHWYAEQAYFEQDYFGIRITSFQKKMLVNQWIQEITQADMRNDAAIAIRVPQSVNSEWPISAERFGELFANTLFGHKIISRHIYIIPVQDMGLTNWLGFKETGGPNQAVPPEAELPEVGAQPNSGGF